MVILSVDVSKSRKIWALISKHSKLFGDLVRAHTASAVLVWFRREAAKNDARVFLTGSKVERSRIFEMYLHTKCSMCFKMFVIAMSKDSMVNKNLNFGFKKESKSASYKHIFSVVRLNDEYRFSLKFLKGIVLWNKSPNQSLSFINNYML